MNKNNNFADSLINNAFSGIDVTDVSNAEAVAALLDKFGLRWTVSKQPLQLNTGEDTGFYGIVRNDTRRTYSTCKGTYVPFQNSELAELLIRISDKTGYQIHSGGEFNGGGKVYLQLNTGTEITNLGANKTTVKGYVTGINSHDGTTALKWGAVNYTVCCRNTFAMAQRALQQSARHTNNIHSKIEESIKQITGIADAEKSIFDNFIRLANVPVERKHIAEIVKTITDVDINLKGSVANAEYTTYAINRTHELMGSINSEMKQKGESLWGLFSGITHYTSHVLTVPNRDNARLESKYTGSGLDIDNTSFKKILEYIN